MAKSANLSSSQDKKKLSRILDTKALQVDKLFAGSKFPTSPSFVKILIGVILAFGVLIFFLNTVDFNKLKSQTSFFQDNPPPPPPPDVISPPEPPADILNQGNVQGEQTNLQYNPNYLGGCYDFDGDGRVTEADVNIISVMFGASANGGVGPTYDARYDLNNDGVVDGDDILMVISQVGRVCVNSTSSPPPTATSSATPTPTPKPVLIPEAPPDIACNGAWQDIKDLGSYAHNAMVSYNGRLILTTVEPNNEAYRYGQKVIAREINPRTNRDTGWYKVGFENSQNSHVLIEQNGQLTLYIYGNVAPGNNRTVFKGVYLGEKRWGNWVNTGALSLGRTGPYTAFFDGQLYRFWANYGPQAVLQRCSSRPVSSPSPQVSCAPLAAFIDPNPVFAGRQVVVKVTTRGFGCNGMPVWVYVGAQPYFWQSCRLSGDDCSLTFTAPAMAGSYPVVAVADLDRDGRWYENGEYDKLVLSVLRGPMPLP